MNDTEALQFAQERLAKIGYDLETSNRLPCRSFYYKQQDMLIQSVAALREKAERDKGCEYCKDMYDLADGYSSEPSLYIDGNKLIARRYDERDSIADIKFCPHCSRKLVQK